MTALRLEPALEHDNCGLHGAARSVRVQILVELSPSIPQTLTLGAMCSSGGDLARTVDRVDCDVGMRLEVEPPGRFGVAPPVHGHGDEVWTVFEVAHDHRVESTGSPADGSQAYGAPLAGLRPPQSQPPAGPAVQAAMGEPKEPDEPAR